MDKLYKVGEYINKYNQILNINLPCISIYASKGLRKHIETRHNNCVDYIEKNTRYNKKSRFCWYKSQRTKQYRACKNL